ncbi:MAG: type VII secretion protein EccC, partial [Mycobacteriaceae bacterium]|nr:type VII secretion protein EccC [Mycobacteriaceae bacterium]
MTAVIEVQGPPEVPRSDPSGTRALPLVMAVGTVGVTAAVLFSGSPAGHHPALLALPAMTLASLALTIGRGRRTRVVVGGDRDEYLDHLRAVRQRITEAALAQHASLTTAYPDPDTLWTLAGGARMWRSRSADPEFCRVRVGVGSVTLEPRLVVGPAPPAQRCDPLTVGALNRFVRTHSALSGAPVTVPLPATGTVTIDGGVDRVRGLLRAMVCQLAISHPPDELQIVGAVTDRVEWDWLKWLPHNGQGVYSTVAEARDSLATAASPHAVVIVDAAEADDIALPGSTLLRVGCEATALTIRHSRGQQTLESPDYLDRHDAVVCARRIAAYAGAASPHPGEATGLLGIDPTALWRSQKRCDRLRV